MRESWQVIKRVSVKRGPTVFPEDKICRLRSDSQSLGRNSTLVIKRLRCVLDSKWYVRFKGLTSAEIPLKTILLGLILPLWKPIWRLVSRFQQKSRSLSLFSSLVETTSSSPSLSRLKKQAWNPGHFHVHSNSRHLLPYLNGSVLHFLGFEVSEMYVKSTTNGFEKRFVKSCLKKNGLVELDSPMFLRFRSIS